MVDSGSGTAPDPISTDFGFTGDTFNQILISQPDGGGPYWLIGDLEPGSTSSVPEPATLGPFAAGLAILASAFWLRRRCRG